MNCISQTPLLFSITPIIGGFVLLALIFTSLLLLGAYIAHKKICKHARVRACKKQRIKNTYWKCVLLILAFITFLVFPAGYTIKTYLLVYAVTFGVLFGGIIFVKKRNLITSGNKTMFISGILLIVFMLLFVLKYIKESQNEKIYPQILEAVAKDSSNIQNCSNDFKLL